MGTEVPLLGVLITPEGAPHDLCLLLGTALLLLGVFLFNPPPNEEVPFTLKLPLIGVVELQFSFSFWDCCCRCCCCRINSSVLYSLFSALIVPFKNSKLVGIQFTFSSYVGSVNIFLIRQDGHTIIPSTLAYVASLKQLLAKSIISRIILPHLPLKRSISIGNFADKSFDKSIFLNLLLKCNLLLKLS